MRNLIKGFLFSSFIFLTAVPLMELEASNFSVSKQEMIAILEDPQLETLLGSGQSVLGIWNQNNSYWVWSSIFCFEVKLTYSPEGQIQLAYFPGVKIIR